MKYLLKRMRRRKSESQWPVVMFSARQHLRCEDWCRCKQKVEWRVLQKKLVQRYRNDNLVVDHWDRFCQSTNSMDAAEN